jgi:hypothetical protein
MSMITEVEADDAAVTARGWRALFEDRYGDGSAARLKAMLEQPCVTFARIAAEFGVTRECVRQWHQRLLPNAPSGHQRQQLCREHQMKRRLLEDELFLRFYRHIRSSVQRRRITLIPSRTGFRKRAVRIDGWTVALRRARRCSIAVPGDGRMRYTLALGGASADFIYYELSSTEYLFVPRDTLPTGGTTLFDAGDTPYQRFMNTLAALPPQASSQPFL